MSPPESKLIPAKHVKYFLSNVSRSNISPVVVESSAVFRGCLIYPSDQKIQSHYIFSVPLGFINIHYSHNMGVLVFTPNRSQALVQPSNRLITKWMIIKYSRPESIIGHLDVWKTLRSCKKVLGKMRSFIKSHGNQIIHEQKHSFYGRLKMISSKSSFLHNFAFGSRRRLNNRIMF